MKLACILLALGVINCAGESKYPARQPIDLARLTVSLEHQVETLNVYIDKDGKIKLDVKSGWFSYCAGTFVSPTLILTAAHCTGDLKIYDKVYFSTYDNQDKHYVAEIWERAASSDLALLQVHNGYPIQDWAQIGPSPVLGDSARTLGHPHLIDSPHAFKWSYVGGWVTRPYHDAEGHDVTQIQMPTIVGMSGGGVFNEQGQLIGVLSYTFKENKNWGFAVSQSEILKFMDR
jgi:S1-C subfamily serine protease